MRLLLFTILFCVLGLGAMNAQTIKKHLIKTKNGVASYYHDKFEGRKTSTGEIFDNDKFTAACNKLKLGTYVKVTNMSNGNVVYVRVNDHMSATNPRLIDLANIAAQQLDFISQGLANVKVEVVSPTEGRSHILAQRELVAEEQTNNEL